MTLARLSRRSTACLWCLALASTTSCGQGAGGPASGGGASNAGGRTSGSGGGATGNGGALSSGGGAGGTESSGGKATGGQGPSVGGNNLGGAPSGGNGQSNSGGSGAGGGAASGGTDSGPTGGSAPSAGCGKAPPESGKKTLDVDGTEREYIVKVPDGYDSQHPYRLILGYHGRMYNAEWVANGEAPLTGPYFGMESEAKGQAIFVATQALPSSWDNQNGQDIAYTKQVISELSSQLCIDENRVFVTGFSYGAIMTIRIGCELAGTIRAIAPMSGSLQNECPTNEKQVAYWASHGLQDTTITPAKGEEVRDEFIQRNHCSADSDASTPSGCVKYRDCDEGYPVSFCTFEGAHVPAPFAGTAIWSFFSQF